MSIPLDQPDLSGLAAFCARRFASAASRARLVAEAGIDLEATDPGDDQRAWQLILEHAQAQGRVSALVGVLARTAPEDEDLREVARVLSPAPPRRQGRWVAAAVLCALVGVAAWARPGEGPAPRQSDARVLVATAPDAANASIETIVPKEATFPGVAGTDEVPVAVRPRPVLSPPEAAPVAAPETDPCTVPGRVAGYWYAGGRSPGAVGAPVTLPTAVNVRADYPRRENGQQARAAVQCVLPAGTRLTLAEAPIAVAGGKWWVPYVVGDGG